VAYSQSPAPIPRGVVKAGTLSFDGHATVGDFVGTTTTVSGEMTGGDSLGSKMLGMLKMDEHIEVHVDVTFAPAP
jgi:hypothetical protein